MLQSEVTDIQSTDFDRIRAFIKQHCGIVVGDEKSYLIESRLARLVAETACSNFTDFYELLEAQTVPGLRDKVIDAITTNETLWFRDKWPFEALRTHLVKEMFAQIAPHKHLRIWSAGCSTGQEPYSLAMVIDRVARENPGLGISLGRCEIMATDISPSVLYLAANGRYDALAIKRGIDESYLARYFEQKGRVWVFDEKLKKAVTFKKFNLQEPFHALGRFDLVLCRNVLIYFSEEFKVELYDRFAGVMNPGAILMLGAAETPLGLTDRFQRYANDDAVYYKVKED
jgi:chemotaxis protein methyltransferase CheR